MFDSKSSYMTIGEFADLMGVSTHQIRYFEEKGVLKPEWVAASGYRLYGMKSVYELAQILMLRAFEIPVKTIKTCLSTYQPSDYEALMQTSVKRIELEIARLTRLKSETEQHLRDFEASKELINQYRYQTFPRRHLKLLGGLEGYLRDVLRGAVGAHERSVPFYALDLVYLDDSCTEAVKTYLLLPETESEIGNKEQTADHALDAGVYWCYGTIVASENELDLEMERFQKAARVQGIIQSGPILVIEKSERSLFYNEGLYYELQMKVAE